MPRIIKRFTRIIQKTGQKTSGRRAIVEAIEPRVMLSVAPVPIDFGTQSSNPTPVVNAGSFGYFLATGTSGQAALFRTDGTTNGTIALKSSFVVGDEPTAMVDMGGALYFSAADTGGHAGLWRSDGTVAGTTLIKQFDPNNGIGGPFDTINDNGTLIFVAEEELWKSDGTTAGTQVVANINPYVPTSFALLGNKVILPASDGIHGYGLWETDGTAGGTIMLSNVFVTGQNNAPSSFLTVGTKVFFTVDDRSTGSFTGYALWATDGTPEGTAQVLKNFPGVTFPVPNHFVSVGNKLVFTTQRAPQGPLGPLVGGPLWASDGTSAGTFSLGATSIGPGAVLNENYYFLDIADGPASLWKTDGTAAGTQSVSTLTQTFAGTTVSAVDQSLYFTQRDPATEAYTIWKSDGIDSGTGQFLQLPSPPLTGKPTNLSEIGGNLLFAMDDGVHGNELWRVNVNGTGLALFADLNTTPVVDHPTVPVVAGNRVYFNAASGGGLISSDNTFSSSVFLGDVTLAGSPARIGNTTYFIGTSTFTGSPGLWTTDDTLAGTSQIATFATTPTDLTAFNGKVFFIATAVGQTSPQVWVSDGTPGGTVALLPIGAATNPRLLTVNGSQLLFASDEGIWHSDGTVGGTLFGQQLAGIQGMAAINGRTLLVNNQATWILAADGVTLTFDGQGFGLGVTPLADHADVLLPGGTTVYFVGTDTSNVLWLCRTDGTPAGSRRITQMSAGIRGGLDGVHVEPGDIYFATDSGAQYQLWHTDGFSPAVSVGTFTGDPSTTIGNLIEVGPIAYFPAPAGVSGQSLGVELWRSDGTASQTFLMNDINPGSGPSSPHGLRAINGHLYFLADDGTHGVQLMTLVPPTQPPAAPANLHAAAVTPFQVALTWTESTPLGDLSGFLVERSLASDLTDISGSFTLPPTATSFTDTLADPGARDYYRVTAISSSGKGTSSTVSAMTPLPPVTGLVPALPPGMLVDPNFGRRTSVYRHQIEFWSNDSLYRTDGTNIVPIPDGVQEFDPSPPQPTPNPAYPWAAVFIDSTRAVYSDADASGLTQYWATNGTKVGTIQLTHFTSQTELQFQQPQFLMSAGGIAFFGLNTVVGRAVVEQLWKSDGTVQGTVMVKTLPLSSLHPQPYSPFASVGKRILIYDNADIWSSDGTAAGTVKIYSNGSINQPSIAGYTDLFQGRAYFTVHTSAGELWSTDGTIGGTTKVPLPVETPVTQLAPVPLFVDDQLYVVTFRSTTPPTADNGFLLWRMTLPPSAPPAAPTNLTAAHSANGVVTLNWTTSATTALDWVLERSTSPTFATIDKSVTIPSTYFSFYVDTTSKPGVSYYYRIHAYNRVGSSAYAYTGHSISGTVFNDANASGTKDTGEVGAANIRVFIDANHNGKLDSGELSTTTTSTGAYSFAHQPAGSYWISEILPTGWRATSASTRKLTLGNSDVGGQSFAVTQKGLISGSVFLDANKNGILNIGEKALAGWRVYLDANNNGIFDAGELSVITGTSGQWSFNNRAAGKYVVRIVQQASYTRTTPALGNFTLTLAAGATSTGHAFGEFH